MQDRKPLNKLVVAFISLKHEPLTAKQIYHELKEERPEALRENKIPCFKSFVRVMPMFKGMERIDSGTSILYKPKPRKV